MWRGRPRRLIALKPIIVLAFIVLMATISVRRAREAGLPASAGLAVPGLIVADSGFALLAGSHWSLGFATGLTGSGFPFFLVLALACVVALALLGSDDGRPLRERFGIPGRAVLWLGAPIAFLGVMRCLITFYPTFFPTVMRSAGPLLALSYRLLPALAAALVVAIAAVVWAERNGGGAASFRR